MTEVLAEAIQPGDTIEIEDGQRREIETVIMGHEWVRFVFPNCDRVMEQRNAVITKIN